MNFFSFFSINGKALYLYFQVNFVAQLLSKMLQQIPSIALCCRATAPKGNSGCQRFAQHSVRKLPVGWDGVQLAQNYVNAARHVTRSVPEGKGTCSYRAAPKFAISNQPREATGRINCLSYKTMSCLDTSSNL